MSKKPVDSDSKPALENKSKSVAAKMAYRFKLMLVLAVLVGITWLGMEFLSGGKLLENPFEQTLSKENPAADVVETQAPPTTIPEEASEFIADAEQVETPEPQVITLEPMTGDVDMEIDPPFPLPLLPPIPPVEPIEEPENTPVVSHQPINIISVESTETNGQLKAQGKIIQILKCQVDMNQAEQDTTKFKRALKQCYAVLVNAGMKPSDHKVLSNIESEHGVPGVESMHRLFKDAAVKTLRMTHKEAGAKTWLDDSIAYTKSLFTIRKTGWQDGEDLEATIGRAEHYLLQKKYEKSQTELEALPTSAAKVFEPYKDAIQQHLAYTNVVELLSAAVAQMEASDDH